METLILWDESAFRFINQGMVNGIFDFLMPWFSNKFIWIPLYALFVYLIITKYKKDSIRLLVVAIATIVISDRTTSGLIKPAVQRYRPCQVAEMNARVLGDGCNSKFGFVSSHASNTIAIVLLLSLMGVIKSRTGLILIWIWVFFVGFSRVYNGVHYPGDIIVGWMTGAFIALFSAWMLKKKRIKKMPS